MRHCENYAVLDMMTMEYLFTEKEIIEDEAMGDLEKSIELVFVSMREISSC